MRTCAQRPAVRAVAHSLRRFVRAIFRRSDGPTAIPMLAQSRTRPPAGSRRARPLAQAHRTDIAHRLRASAQQRRLALRTGVLPLRERWTGKVFGCRRPGLRLSAWAGIERPHLHGAIGPDRGGGERGAQGQGLETSVCKAVILWARVRCTGFRPVRRRQAVIPGSQPGPVQPALHSAGPPPRGGCS